MKAFDKLVAPIVNFYGVDNNYFKLGNTVFEAVEDPGDGYRSYLETVVASNRRDLIFNLPEGVPVIIVPIDTESFRGYSFIDLDDHEWLRFGTDTQDDYYPCFIFYYKPKEL